MRTVLACDLGGSSFRAALVDEAGATVAEATVAGPFPSDRDGCSEIDPAAWWRALGQAATRLADKAPAAFVAVQGVAICGITRTQVLLDGGGQALRPALTWKDVRADALASRMRARLGRHPEAGQVNAFHPLARLAWLGEREPAALRQLACVLEPKDYLNLRLTGEAASDPVSLARLIACSGTVDGIDPLGMIGLSGAILPALREPWERVGTVLQGLPPPFDRLAGVPVFCCCNDTWAAVAGLGAMRPGFAYNISGTTEVLGVVGEEPIQAEGLLTVDWRGLFQLGGPSQNGADTASWLLSLLSGGEAAEEGVGARLARLLALPRQPQPVLFLPYLQGERVPYWDANLRGAFLGLDRRHGAGDLAWAVLEGVACLNRIVLERAEAASGRPVSEIRFGGGAAANPVWAQIKADLCGRPVVVGRAKEPGLLGAAIIAWTGLGRFASLAEAQDSLIRVARRFEPDPARQAAYETLFALFRRAEIALAPISRELAAFPAGTIAGDR